MTLTILEPGDESTIENHARWVASQNFDRVLDIGGFEKPLRAATHVLDLFPYALRRVDEGRGPLPERFSEEAWTEQDACLRLPYEDGFFDYVWCCQVVEDVRDPIRLCNEMMRVGQAGFVSTVHRSYESGIVQYDGVVGYHHHRWLIEIVGNEVVFTFKSPILQVAPDLRTRPSQWLLHWTWRWQFNVSERFVGGDQGQYRELREYLVE